MKTKQGKIPWVMVINGKIDPNYPIILPQEPILRQAQDKAKRHNKKVYFR